MDHLLVTDLANDVHGRDQNSQPGLYNSEESSAEDHHAGGRVKDELSSLGKNKAEEVYFLLFH